MKQTQTVRITQFDHWRLEVVEVGSHEGDGRMEANGVELQKGRVRIEIRPRERLVNAVEFAVQGVVFCA